ncbi:MAG: RtcB family protein, partial [Chitinispirillaceae bacterium]|nr:RtcB family protein [Chitinispirillaceae bacterium]
MKAIAAAEKSGDYPRGIKHILKRCVERPDAFVTNAHFGELARALIGAGRTPVRRARPGVPAPSTIWGEGFEKAALGQLNNACSLPVSVRAALMPDAHVGYGLPIGGVLATRGAVIPFAVGVDIACRMKMTVFDVPVAAFEADGDRFKRALTRETAFGVGAEFRNRR